MTRKRFIKKLRSFGATEHIIKSLTKFVADLGGNISYKYVYDTIVECLAKQIIGGYKQPEIEFTPYEFDFNESQSDYLLNYYNDVKVLDHSYMVKVCDC